MSTRKRLPIALLLIGLAAAAPGDTGRTIIRDQRAAERLRGNDGLTLQWIGWDRRGALTVRQQGPMMLLKGSQRAASGPGLLTLEGEVTEIEARQFRFRGRIVIRDTPDVGRQCVRDGDFTFAITQKRRYWRLQQMEVCDRLTDYVDIYF
ncbi:hypothetical protein BH10PSE13_BH10PSE13_04020 [soil metagenome]